MLTSLSAIWGPGSSSLAVIFATRSASDAVSWAPVDTAVTHPGADQSFQSGTEVLKHIDMTYNLPLTTMLMLEANHYISDQSHSNDSTRVRDTFNVSEVRNSRL